MSEREVNYILPTHWGEYLMTDDSSGLSEAEVSDCDRWWYKTFTAGAMVTCLANMCIIGYTKEHDALEFLSECNCSIFKFSVRQ